MSKEPEAEEEIDLLELVFSIIKRTLKHKVAAVVVFILVSGLAFAIALLSTPFYKTNAKIIYQTSGGSQSGSLNALAALAGVSSSKTDDPSAYLSDIILSNYMLQSILAEKWKVSLALPDTSTPVTLQTLWKIEPDTTQEDWQIRLEYGMLDALKKGGYIVFSQDKKSGVITLATEFEDPQVSYDVNNFVFKQLNDILLNKMHFKASENRKFTEERLSEVKESLNKAEEVLRSFRQNNRLRIDPTDQLEDSRLQRDVLMNQEIMIQLQKQYELAKIEEARDMPVLDVIDIPMKPIEKSKPKRRLIVLAGGVAAVFFAILTAVLYDVFLEKKSAWRKYVT
ncbi:MAG: Wzz/FepE/Etk N-terminal domain-containing protein [Fibromonadales bacterium]|nr:Wzz/FepE/Etk N-terminal domain-containing protein [Fibromonadales bacterium]